MVVVVTDEVGISSGGAVAVDTARLRDAATVLVAAAARLDEAVADIARADARISAHTLPVLGLTQDERLREVGALADRAREQQDRLLMCAAAYEVAEIRAEAALASAAGDADAVARARDRITALERAHPGAAELLRADGGFSDGWTWFTLLMPFLAGASLASGAVIARLTAVRGRIPFGTRPAPTGRPVPEVVPLPPASRPAAAPTALAPALERIPQGGDARVRIEEYATASGTAYAVYVAGTSGLGGDEVWDMLSNVQGYGGEQSDSYLALTAMLAEAGVQPGATLYLYGHSQGGMLVGQLAATGDYDVRVVGTAGSPTAADPGPEAMSVDLRHGDDPVAMLAGGGFPTRVGAEGSFVATRLVDPAPGPQDLGLPAHHLSAYADTAALVDASADPRVAEVHERMAELEGARLISAQEFGARQADAAPRRRSGAVSPVASGAG
jgi:hypothetical protein